MSTASTHDEEGGGSIEPDRAAESCSVPRWLVWIFATGAVAAIVALSVAVALLASSSVNIPNAGGRGYQETGISLDNAETIDIAVVGGGVSGAYTAWRLKYASVSEEIRPGTTIKLFERTNRIGGRLYSPSIGCKVADGAARGAAPHAELGGMRLRNTDAIAQGLVRHLNITMGPFNMNSQGRGGFDDPENPVFLRGWRGSRSAAKNAGDTNSTSFKELQEYYQHELDGRAILDAFDAPPSRTTTAGFASASDCGVKPISASEYDPCSPSNYKVLESDCAGMPAYKWSVQEFQQRHMNVSEEGISFRDDVSGYHDPSQDINLSSQYGETLGSFVPIRDVGEFKYTRPLEGMQTIPLAVHKAFMDAGGLTEMSSQLDSVTVLPAGSPYRFLLRFKRTFTHPCTEVTTVKSDSKDLVVYANRLILAGWDPQKISALRINAIDDKTELPVQHPSQKDIQTVTGMVTNSGVYQKFFFAFDAKTLAQYTPPGSATKPFTAGRYTTSTAPQQLFKWYPGTQQLQADPVCNQIQVLQMYTADPLWAAMANEASQFECPASVTAERCHECPGAMLMHGNARNHINKNIVSLFRRHLSVLLNASADRIPEAMDAKYSVWDVHNPQTQSHAFHTWRPSARWWEGFEAALQPTKDLPLHIVGEAFALHQGWVEGALQTSEYMLQEKFGLQMPDWFSELEYCESMPFYPSERRDRSFRFR